MGNNIIAKTIEDLYVTNTILVPKYKNEKGEVKMPPIMVETVGANEARTKVYATVTLKEQPFGEMAIYLLKYGKGGQIASHDYLGKAGYHIVDATKNGVLFEYNPNEKGNLNEAQLKMIGANPTAVTNAVKMHATQMQNHLVTTAKAENGKSKK